MCTTALGMNSGIQDAYNLVWKLALAIKDPYTSHDALLDTYHTERAEVGKRVGQTSLDNMRRHSGQIDGSMGVCTTQTKAENLAAAASFFDDKHPGYALKQRRIKKASQELDTEFKAPGYEVGWFHPSADLENEGGDTHGGQQPADGTLVHHTYYMSTTPGHHLPHTWLQQDDDVVAICDLLDPEVLTLFVAKAAQDAEIKDDRVRVVLVGDGGWHDMTGRWIRCGGVDETGGVLVRPDGIVAWRGGLLEKKQREWRHLVDTILKVTR